MRRERNTSVQLRKLSATFSHRALHTLAARRRDWCSVQKRRAILKDRVVPKEALRTALVEAEGVLNSRPITHVSSDAGDIEALTPNHLLLLRANPSFEDANVSDRGSLKR